MYELWVTNWLYNKAFDNEFDYPWPNIFDSDDTENSIIRDMHKWTRNNWNEKNREKIINDTTRNITNITTLQLY